MVRSHPAPPVIPGCSVIRTLRSSTTRARAGLHPLSDVDTSGQTARSSARQGDRGRGRDACADCVGTSVGSSWPLSSWREWSWSQRPRPAAVVGSVSATPTTGLGWRDDVTVTITGAPALAPLRIIECYWDIDPDGGCSTIGTPTTDAAGAAVAVVTTRRSVHDEEGGGDCWSPHASRCELAVYAA